jgi:hypothetical protein
MQLHKAAVQTSAVLWYSMLILLLALACSQAEGGGPMPQPSAPATVTYGVYFGECVGYCIDTVEVNPTETVYTKKSNVPSPDMPDKIYRTPTKPETWQHLTGALDWGVVRTLPARFGQPDAADQGGEYVEIAVSGETRRSDLEYGATVPELARLLDLLRALRTDLVSWSGF